VHTSIDIWPSHLKSLEAKLLSKAADETKELRILEGTIRWFEDRAPRETCDLMNLQAGIMREYIEVLRKRAELVRKQLDTYMRLTDDQRQTFKKNRRMG